MKKTLIFIIALLLLLTLLISCEANGSDDDIHTDEQSSERTTITLGIIDLREYFGVDYTMMRVFEFNQRNRHYQIEVVNYTTDDLMRLRTELVAGSGPDILYTLFFEDSIFTPLMSQGLLADLWSFIDADPVINRSDFWPNILEAMQSSDGSLPVIANQFTIQSLISRPETISNAESLTISYFLETIRNAVEAGIAYPMDDFMSGIDFLLYLLLYVDLGIIDLDAGVSDFESRIFFDILELADILPREGAFDDFFNSYERLRRGEQLFMNGAILYPFSYAGYETFLGEFVMLGDPSDDGGVHGAIWKSILAMSAVSNNQEAAWSFIRRHLLWETEMDFTRGLPMRIDLFEEQVLIARRAHEVVTTENGDEIEIPNHFRVFNEIEFPVNPLTAEGAIALREIIESVSFVSRQNQHIAEILMEELPHFFSGSRTAEDTARIIQSRVQLYLGERS